MLHRFPSPPLRSRGAAAPHAAPNHLRHSRRVRSLKILRDHSISALSRVSHPGSAGCTNPTAGLALLRRPASTCGCCGRGGRHLHLLLLRTRRPAPPPTTVADAAAGTSTCCCCRSGGLSLLQQWQPHWIQPRQLPRALEEKKSVRAKLKESSFTLCKMFKKKLPLWRYSIRALKRCYPHGFI